MVNPELMSGREIPSAKPDMLPVINPETKSEEETLNKIRSEQTEITNIAIENGRLEEYLRDLNDFTHKLEERDREISEREKKGEENIKESKYRKYKAFHVLAFSTPDNENSPKFDLEGEYSAVNFSHKLYEKYVGNLEQESLKTGK